MIRAVTSRFFCYLGKALGTSDPVEGKTNDFALKERRR